MAATVVLGTSIWLAFSWIDKGDSTCGALVYPSMWLDDGAPEACRSTMFVRGLVCCVVGIAAAALVRAASGMPLRRAMRPRSLVAGAAVVSAILLLLNEVIRSDGAL